MPDETIQAIHTLIDYARKSKNKTVSWAVVVAEDYLEEVLAE